MTKNQFVDDLFLYYHGTSDANLESISEKGIVGNDSFLSELSVEIKQLRDQICIISNQHFMDCYVYDGFSPHDQKTEFAYRAVLNNSFQNVCLAFSTFNASNYSQNIGGEFKWGLYESIIHLKWIVDNYAEFEEKRRTNYEQEKANISLSLPHETFYWLPYEKLSLDFLKFKLNYFTNRFLKDFEKTLSLHKNFIIIACKPSKFNIIFNSKIGMNEIIFPKINTNEILAYCPVEECTIEYNLEFMLLKINEIKRLYQEKDKVENYYNTLP